MIYGVLRFRWPEAYLSLSDTFGLTFTTSATRFLTFRGLPIVVVVWAVAVTVDRLGGVGWISALLGVLGHLGFTNFKAAWIILRGQAVVNHFSYHVVISVVVLLSAGSGIALSYSLPGLVPSPEAFLEDVWLAILISLLGGSFLLGVNRMESVRPEAGPGYYEWRVRRDLGLPLLDDVFQRSLAADKDPFLVTSIVMAEVLQRPKWFRRAERATAWLRRNGTYGVMQIRSSKPLSDAESIVLGIAAFPDARGLTRGDSHSPFSIDRHALWGVSSEYHGDKVHIETVIEIYEHLTTYGHGMYARDPSYTRTAVFECRRYGSECGVRGATFANAIRVLSRDGTVLAESDFPYSTNDAEGLVRFFELKIPMAEGSFVIEELDYGNRLEFDIPLQGRI